jgi:HEAT repeat protein
VPAARTRWIFEQVGIDPNAETVSEAEVDRLIYLLRGRDSTLRHAASQALGELRVRRAVPVLIQALKGDRTVWNLADSAAWALGEIGDPAAVEPLLAAGRAHGFNGWILQALGKLRDVRVVEPLVELLERTGDPSAATVLGNLGDHRAVDALIRALQHPHPRTRFYAARALGKLGDPRALPALEWLHAHDSAREPVKSWRGKSVSDVAGIAVERLRSRQREKFKHDERRAAPQPAGRDEGLEPGAASM